MRKLNWNTLILAITIVLFLILLILSTTVHAKSPSESNEETDTMKDSLRTEYEISLRSYSPSVEIYEVYNELETKVYEEKYTFDRIGYSNVKLNIREEPSISSNIIGQYYYNEEIEYCEYDDDWAAVYQSGKIGFIFRGYVSDEQLPYISKQAADNTRKSFEDYRCLSTKSRQGMLQTIADTSPSGLRKVDNRYCVAVGSYFSHDIGKYIDVVLQNGKVIPCIIADAKADVHTDDSNAISHDGSCIEFIVDIYKLPNNVKKSGDCSGCKNDWNSPVVEIRLYDYTTNI